MKNSTHRRNGFHPARLAGALVLAVVIALPVQKVSAQNTGGVSIADKAAIEKSSATTSLKTRKSLPMP